MMTKDTEMSGR